MKSPRRRAALAAKVGASTLSVAALMSLQGVGVASAAPLKAAAAPATTPIQHVVVIYGENISFDHYFGTYPNATNPAGEPTFTAKAGTPAVNGLVANAANGNENLLTANPNSAQPQRLDPKAANQVLTCDQNHGYAAEQKAFDNGKMDAFPANVGNGSGSNPAGGACASSDDMNYYDGNTVTGLWNYAQNYALNDNSFSTTFGPSTPGAINVISGDTGNVSKVVGVAATNGAVVPDGQGADSDISDTAPYYDDCPDYTNQSIALSGKNVGDQLNAAGLSWGWFEGGFAPTTAYSGPSSDPGYVSPTTGSYESGETAASCAATHNVGAAIGGTGSSGAKAYGTKSDYIAHHEPFQYYASTANPHHLAPTSLAAVGTDTQSYNSSGQPEFNTANHNYDISVFNNLLGAIAEGSLSPDHLPAVSYLKAPGNEDGHAAYSDPLDEQQFVTTEINDLEQTPDWSSTAVILAYDDSDGWYDHVDAANENGGAPQNASQVSGQDSLTGAGQCGTATPTFTNTAGQPEQGRCGYGPRQPLQVISPYAKGNYVSHTLTDQSSVVKFIEDNWSLGSIAGSAANTAGSLADMFNFAQAPTPALYLSPATGQPESDPGNLGGPGANLPESQFPIAFVAIGAAVLGGGAAWEMRRRRRRTVSA